MIPWWEVLTALDSELRARGIEDPRTTRFELTGHHKPLLPKWARTVGLWGRIATLVEIEVIAGGTAKATRRFAESHGLHWAGGKGTQAQVNLAAWSYDDHVNSQLSVKEICTNRGLLPVEVKLYVSAMRDFLDEWELDLTELVDRYHHDKAEMWLNSGYWLRLPEKAMIEIGGGDDRLPETIHRRLGRAPAEPFRRI